MAGIIYLGVLLLAPSCSLPGRQMGRAAPSPCLALLLVWFAWPATLLPPPVVSYTAVSPSQATGNQLLAIYLSVALFRQVTLPGS